MYTYIQPHAKKIAMYIHTGGVSNAYSCIRMARARVHGWVGAEKLRRLRDHGEATGWVRTTCVVMIIGSQPAWTEQPIETRPGVPQNGGNGLVFDRHVRKGILFIGRGLAYRKTEETDLLRLKRGSC